MAASVKLALLLLVFSVCLCTGSAASGHDHSGHSHGDHDDHDDHNDHDDHFGHDHLGRPHGQGEGDEDCPDDEDDHHGHSHDHDHDHGDDDHDDHDDHDHESTYDGKEGDCPSTTHTFDGTHSYIKLMNPAPAFKDLTVCNYVTTDKVGTIKGVLGSLSQGGKPNSFAVLGFRERKKSFVRVILEGQVKKVATTLPENAEIHLCLVTSVNDNTATIFLNGRKTRALKYRRLRGIPEGGAIMIGRIEDDKFPMYTGKIRDFMMWDRQLTADEIMKIKEMNHCPAGAKVTLLESEIVPQKANVPAAACVGGEYTLDNSGDKVEYLEAAQSVKDLKYVTICVKVTTNMFGVIPGTIASYATRKHPEMIAVGGERDSKGAKLRVTVQGVSKVLDGQFAPNTAYRFCLVYHLPHGHVITYVNGVKARELQFETMGHLPGGGTILVGQYQRKLGGCFDKSKAYNGKLADFAVWDRALTEEELRSMAAKDSVCPTDAVVVTDLQNVLPHGKFGTYGTCPSADYTLKNDAKTTEYIEVFKTLPLLDYLTTCSRVTTNAVGMIPGTIGSYATSDDPVAFSVGGEMGPNGPAFRVTVNGQYRVKDAQFVPNTEYSFCVSLHLSHDHVLTYVNGKFTSNFEFRNLGSLAGGGKIIIGQKQGCEGGCFDPKAAYVGRIRDFMLWERILSVQEIEAIANSNECPLDINIDITSGNAVKISKVDE